MCGLLWEGSCEDVLEFFGLDDGKREARSRTYCGKESMFSNAYAGIMAASLSENILPTPI